MSADFDATADGYDEVAASDLGLVLRDRVHARMSPLVRSGTTMLDLGCGTGLDALWAVDRGAEVVALDASAQMVRHATERLGDRVRVHRLDLNSEDWAEGLAKSFDVVLANFGVVNCLHNLVGFGRGLDAVLVEGGVVVLVPMSRIVPWELVPAVARLDIATARRRFGRGAVDASDNSTGRVRYHSGRSLVASLGSAWRLVSAEALGWTLPTYERRGAVQGRPRLLRTLASLDSAGARLVGRAGVGDHQIVLMVRRSDGERRGWPL